MSRGGFSGRSRPSGSRGFGGGGRGGPRGGGGGRGGFQRGFDSGPPDVVLEMGSFIHAVEDEMLCSSLMADKVPYFNAPIYLQNKSVIGKVDEILGPLNEVFFSVKMGEGMVASSFKKGDKVYIGGDKLLPIERFLPKPKVQGVAKRARTTRGASRGAGFGASRGAPRGRGFSRGGSRGARGSRGFGSFSGTGRGRGSARGFSRGA